MEKHIIDYDTFAGKNATAQKITAVTRNSPVSVPTEDGKTEAEHLKDEILRDCAEDHDIQAAVPEEDDQRLDTETRPNGIEINESATKRIVKKYSEFHKGTT